MHATGHSSRLDRGIDTNLAPFGSPDYSKEELVAEMGSAYLCAVAGISPLTIEQSAAYLAGWLRKLKQDKKLLVQAAGQAQNAADHILGVTFGEAAGGDRKTERRVSETPEPLSRVQRDLGFQRAETVEHLIRNTKLHESLRDQVIWIDEAGLLDVRSMNAVFDIAKEQNARVVLSGDTRQHASPRRGDPC